MVYLTNEALAESMWFKNNKQKIFSFSAGIRVVSDMQGEIVSIYGAESAAVNASVMTARGEYSFIALPNCRYVISDKGVTLAERVPCALNA